LTFNLFLKHKGGRIDYSDPTPDYSDVAHKFKYAARFKANQPGKASTLASAVLDENHQHTVEGLK
jgi:hypothetical protein